MVSICNSLNSALTLTHSSMAKRTTLWILPNMLNLTASGSESTSGRSSDTNTEVTSTSQEEGGAADMVVAMAAHQAALPVLDRPIPPCKRQRKPNRKTVKSEAESPGVISPIKKRRRKPKTAGRLSPLSSILVSLPVLKLSLGSTSLPIRSVLPGTACSPWHLAPQCMPNSCGLTLNC